MTALAITPVKASIISGSTEQYTATATYSDNSVSDVSAKWTVSSSSIASINGLGLLRGVSPGNYTVTATIGSLSATIAGSVLAAAQPVDPGSGPGTGTSVKLPIAIYTGVDFSKFSVFNVSTYAASGSAATGTCTGLSGSKQLTCTGLSDFAPGQGIRIVGGGKAPHEAAIVVQPLITTEGKSTSGSHTYCYVVDTVDPLGGISAPSPQACVTNESKLSMATASNYLTTTTSNVGPSPSFLWYVSEDGGPFLLLNVAGFASDAVDLGQRLGSPGGWPDNLAPANPSIAKQDDLFSTVQAVTGEVVILADALGTSVQNAKTDHDDTQAVQNAILAAVESGGGTISFGSGTFNLRRPVFPYVVDHSFAYPPYTTDLSLDPWWARYSYLYIPNGSVGNINLQGAGSATMLVTAPDHGGTTCLLQVGLENRSGTAPIFPMQEVSAGATQITLGSEGAASNFSPGDDIFIYSGSFRQTPEVDTGGVPGMHHFSELNTVASVDGDTITLVYPTSKRYFDDGGSSFGLTKLPITPHNIEIQHLTLQTSDAITASGDVFGLLVNDLQVQGNLKSAFGGGYKRGFTVENSSWTLGEGTSGSGEEEEYDQFTTVAFLHNKLTGFAAPGSEGPSGMARLFATEGTSQLLFEGNVFDHISLYAGQTTDYYVLNNTFVDGIIAAGVAYGLGTKQFDPSTPGDRSFLSFASQEYFSADGNTFLITSDFNPPWIIRAGDFSSGNISDNQITYSGTHAPGFMIGTFNGTVLNNTISIQSQTVGNIIALIPDQSPNTPMSSFTAEGNVTSAHIISADIIVPNPGFTDTAPVCVQNNTLYVSQGIALLESSSIVNQQCPEAAHVQRLDVF
jgi:hypothetical protein